MIRALVLTLPLCALAGCASLEALRSAPQDWSWPSLEPRAPERVLLPGDASHFGAPEGLRATSGEYRMIPLKWDPVLSGDVAGYLLEHANRAEGPFERLAIIEGRGRLAHLDGRGARAGEHRELGDGETRYYRIRAFDTDSRLSPETSDVVVATTAPLPDPPEGILAYSRQPREIPLSWRSVEGPAVGGYRVERSLAPEGPFEEVAALEGRNATNHVDAGLGDLRVFYYRVRTVNLGGVAGHPSPPVRAVTKPVPLPPVGLRVAGQALGHNELGWEANVEDDLVAYQVFRIGAEGDATLVATVGVDQLSALDDGVEASEALIYTVRAQDRDGLLSADSLPIPVTSEGYALRGDITPEGILLTWDTRTDEGYEDALIERRSWIEPPRVYRTHEGRFLDEGVTPGRRYEYAVTLERLDGTRAPKSRTVTVELPEVAEGE